MSKKMSHKRDSRCCPFSKNEEYIVEITDIGNEGQGIGRIDGVTVFVKEALPGDRIRCRIIKVAKNYAIGRMMEIINQSPDRVDPVCSYAARCGGCELQHLSYEKQIAFKQNQIKNCLTRIGGFDASFIESIMEPILAMDDPFHYRNKAQFPVGRNEAGNISLGFYARRSHTIVDTDSCEIQSDISNEVARLVRAWMLQYDIQPYHEETHSGLIRHVLTRIGYYTGQVMVCLVTTSWEVPNMDALVASLQSVTGLASVCLNKNSEKTNRILGLITSTQSSACS